jgi:hypothetical protein
MSSSIASLKVAVFGGSSYGKNCIKYILAENGGSGETKGGEVEFVGFYEEDEEVASSLLSLFDIKRFSDHKELLDIADAVIIALPVQERYKTAVAALREGKHILVESPVSYKPLEIKHLISIANEAQVVHAVNIGEILLRAGSEKEPLFIDSKRYINNSRNIFDVLVEDVHLFMKMTNSEVKKVRKNIIGKNIAIRFEFENEAAAHYLLVDGGVSAENSQEAVVYSSSDTLIMKEKKDMGLSVKKDIETFFLSIFDNAEYYPFFEKEFVSIDITSKII